MKPTQHLDLPEESTFCQLVTLGDIFVTFYTISSPFSLLLHCCYFFTFLGARMRQNLLLVTSENTFLTFVVTFSIFYCTTLSLLLQLCHRHMNSGVGVSISLVCTFKLSFLHIASPNWPFLEFYRAYVNLPSDLLPPRIGQIKLITFLQGIC